MKRIKLGASDLIAAGEAKRLLGVKSYSTLYGYADRGWIAQVRYGRTRRFSRASIVAFQERSVTRAPLLPSGERYRPSEVAQLLTHPQDRLLSIEGQESTIYRADDPEAERRAWTAVRFSRARP